MNYNKHISFYLILTLFITLTVALTSTFAYVYLSAKTESKQSLSIKAGYWVKVKVTLIYNDLITPNGELEITYNDTYSSLPIPTRDGYTFTGWYTDNSAGEKINNSTKLEVTTNHTLYARWTPATYTITFNPNGGQVQETTKTVTFNTEYGTLPEPTKKGAIFQGWYTSQENGNLVTSTTTVTTPNNHNLYAHWLLTFSGKIISKANPLNSTSFTSKEAYTFSEPTTDQLGAVTEYRYVGSDPNNYVSFNCDNNGTNCELWRIIGVFETQSVVGGPTELRVKLMRADGIGKLAYDTKGDYGINEWTTSELKTLLNEGDYYNRTGDFSSLGLKTDAKIKIENAVYYLGGTNSYSTTANGLVSHWYNYERGTAVYSGHSTNWVGKVGLMYPSDYGFATSGGSTYNRDACLNKELFSWHTGDYKTDCAETSFVKGSELIRWTMTPRSDLNSGIFAVTVIGTIGNSVSPKALEEIMPVVYLSADIYSTGGNGTITNPYTLSNPVAITLSSSVGTIPGGSKIGISSGKYKNLPTPKVPLGYEFLGWYTDETGGIKVENGDNLVSSTSHTLYARYNITPVTLTSRIKSMVNPLNSSSFTSKEAYTFNEPATTQLGAVTEYRYVGSDPNNYVSFNCDNDGTNCELWRAIGVFETQKTIGGTTEQRVKLIRESSIGNIAWDTKETYGVNEWSTSELKTLLNEGNYYNRSGTYATNGLKISAKNMIENAVFYLGGASNYNSATNGLTSHFYNYERGTDVYSSDRTTAWTGKVGLMYLSDYGFATSGGTTYNRTACLEKEMYSWDSGNYSTDCGGNSYLKGTTDLRWTINPSASVSYNVLGIRSTTGYIEGYRAKDTYGTFPVVYLKASVMTSSGDGTIDNPYKLD